MRHGLFFLAFSFAFFCALWRSAICANARKRGRDLWPPSGVAGLASLSGKALFALPAPVHFVGQSCSILFVRASFGLLAAVDKSSSRMTLSIPIPLVVNRPTYLNMPALCSACSAASLAIRRMDATCCDCLNCRKSARAFCSVRVGSLFARCCRRSTIARVGIVPVELAAAVIVVVLSRFRRKKLCLLVDIIL